MACNFFLLTCKDLIHIKYLKGAGMNLKLKSKIIEKFGQQWRFCKTINMHDSLLSKFITGARDPNTEHKKLIAEGLGCEIKDLFPEK